MCWYCRHTQFFASPFNSQVNKFFCLVQSKLLKIYQHCDAANVGDDDDDDDDINGMIEKWRA